MGEDLQRSNNTDSDRGNDSASGWVTTKQAARSLDISPRTVRWHIEHGNLEAKPEGKGVKRTWLVSIDSLQTFRDSRQSPRSNRESEPGAAVYADIPGNPIRELADRLAEEAARAAEYRVRLEITEKAQSTLEEQLLQERRSQEKAEERTAVLEAELETLRGSKEPQNRAESVGSRSDKVETSEEPEEATESRSWWRRVFGG